jgi:large subunit ribosomal protein L29
MKAQQVRDLDDSELASKLREIEEQQFRIRFQMTMGQTDGIKKFRANRKDRARILTIQNERKQAAK